MNELLKNDFLNACNNNQIISTYMINDFMYDYITKNKIEDYVSGIKYLKSIHKSFDSNSKDYEETVDEGFAGYSTKSGTISFYRTKLMQYYLYLFKKDNIYQLTQDEIVKFNLECIDTIIHELTHAKQNAIVNGDYETKEAIYKVLKLEFDLEKFNVNKFIDLYNRYYEYFVSEYNASLEASIYANKLISNTDYKKLNTKKIFDKAYLDKSLVEKFLLINDDNINNYDYHNLTNKEKILYGFPRK